MVEAGDWKAALAAFEEAAQLVTDEEYARGELLDGAALAAQELGKKDLSPWFARAWRGAPTMLGLRRWLGSARSRVAIRKRAAEALAACPKPAHRQLAFLHVVQDDFEPAAKLLASAPGLGWSDGEHPGHLLFPLFHVLLGGNNDAWTRALPERGMGIDEVGFLTAEPDAPRLATPEVGDILRQAGIDGIEDAKARRAVIAAMRKAAEKRSPESRNRSAAANTATRPGSSPHVLPATGRLKRSAGPMRSGRTTVASMRFAVSSIATWVRHEREAIRDGGPQVGVQGALPPARVRLEIAVGDPATKLREDAVDFVHVAEVGLSRYR